MPLLLRICKLERWEDVAWASSPDVQADSQRDLATEDNRLSFWRIADNRSNLDHVLVALGAGRDRLAKLDYALIEEALVSSLGISIVTSSGEKCANRDIAETCHCELVQLTVAALVKLGQLIKAFFDDVANDKEPLPRLLQRDLAERILRALEAGEITETLFGSKIRADVNRAIKDT